MREAKSKNFLVNMKILILDDDWERHHAFRRKMIGHVVKHVVTSKECIEALETEEFDIAFLDHDLGGQTMVDPTRGDTGYAVAEWISKNLQKKPARVIVHSFNPVGGPKMEALIPGSKWIPGAWSKIK